MKYELTNCTAEISGRRVHRIRALRDLPWAKKGALGGWVESENCLSQEGDAWVGGYASVFNGSYVGGNALVEDLAHLYNTDAVDNAHVFGETILKGSKVSGNAKVCGNAHVYQCGIFGDSEVSGRVVLRDSNVSDRARICDNVWGQNVLACGDAQILGSAKVIDSTVSDHAVVKDRAKLSKHVEVSGRAEISGNATLEDRVSVFENAGISGDVLVKRCARIHGSVKLRGYLLIDGDADIACAQNYIVFSFGEYKREKRFHDVLTAFRNTKGGLSIQYYNYTDRSHPCTYGLEEIHHLMNKLNHDAMYYTHGNKLDVYKQSIQLARCLVQVGL